MPWRCTGWSIMLAAFGCAGDQAIRPVAEPAPAVESAPAAKSAPVAESAPAAESMQMITLRVPGDVRQATWTRSRVFGSTIDLTHDQGVYRGRVLDAPVELRTGNATVEGTRGGRTELHLEMRGDGFTVRGLNAGKLGSLEVRADRIVGQIGGCQYDLRALRPGIALYRGTRVCAARPEPTELSLPAAVVALPPEHRAALLSIFLGP